MLYRRPIEHRHACSETDMPDRSPTCLIGDQNALSEINIYDRRPSGERHVCSLTDMPYRRPTCLISDPQETDRLDQACPMGLV